MSRLPIDISHLESMPPCRLVVGFSGGLDSTALLHALAARADIPRSRLHAVHVHHGLHADADRWEAACGALCESLGVSFQSIRVSVEARGLGLEGAAREARHAALQSVLESGDVVALAHHRDDQAETFLLRALRASGPDGLGAMRPWRRFGRGWLWRPLLDVPRSTLEAYARAHALSWIDDPSNLHDGPDRNFLRLQVLPLLRARWPHADMSLASAAARSADAADLLEDEDERLLATARRDAATLDVDALRDLAPARRARVLRRWVASLALPKLPAEGIDRIERELLAARPDAHAEFIWKGARIRRWTGLLRAERIAPMLARDWSGMWDGMDTLVVPHGGEIALDPPRALPETVVVRARRGGERIRLRARTHSHALKHVLQDRAVPVWDRERLPLLFAHDGELLAAGDIAFSERFEEWLGANATTLVWRRPPAVPER